MALTQPRGFVGQVRGVSHHGQEIDLHLKAGYIDADFPSSINFSLAFRRRTIHLTKFEFATHTPLARVKLWTTHFFDQIDDDIMLHSVEKRS
jgi:hypothetical protein